jgi:hypothetical protein
MKRASSIVFFFVCLLIASCKTTTPNTVARNDGYTEDLASLRPVFEIPEEPIKPATELPKKKELVEAKHTVNVPLHAVLDSIDRINLLRKSVDGFTIQVYSGQKREDALNAKRTIDQALPELKAEMLYIQPTFRIKAGKYYTQLDAQKDFVAVKRFFPNAILVPDKIATGQ